MKNVSIKRIMKVIKIFIDKIKNKIEEYEKAKKINERNPIIIK